MKVSTQFGATVNARLYANEKRIEVSVFIAYCCNLLKFHKNHQTWTCVHNSKLPQAELVLQYASPHDTTYNNRSYGGQQYYSNG